VHVHDAKEGFLVILPGRPLLVPDNVRDARAWSSRCLRRPEDAHAIGNADDATEHARVLLISTMRSRHAAEHVSTGHDARGL
jgi:hypothetical protein